ncbi:hypothetical protein PANI_CDS0070 [Maribacter phage Panino]
MNHFLPRIPQNFRFGLDFFFKGYPIGILRIFFNHLGSQCKIINILILRIFFLDCSRKLLETH